MWTIVWCVSVLFARDGKEPTDRLIPPSWQGNPWGPAATKARQTGELEPVPFTPQMKQWDAWGKRVLKNGDIVFRLGDARVMFGWFPFSRFIANASGSCFSHTGVVAIEDGEPVVYDTTKAGVRRQPFAVWTLDNIGPLGVKRLRPDLQSRAQAVVRYCREVFAKQVPFDYELGLDDKALYCVEMTEKAFRAAGLVLSQPVRLGDMENISKFPVRVFVFLRLSDLTLDQAAFFPGNDRHGIWSSPLLTTIYQTPNKPTTATAQPDPKGKPAHHDPASFSLDMGMRRVCNARSGGPGEIPDEEVNAQLENPG
jgi:hypothetical protein